MITIEEISNESTNAGYYGGGIVGNNQSKIQYCYNLKDIENNSTKPMIGGIVGHSAKAREDVECVIKNCYNTASITSSSNYIGGLAGNIQNNCIFNNCYILNSIKVKNKTDIITTQYGNLSNNYTGRFIGNKDNSSTVIEIKELSSDEIPTVYEVMNKFSNEQSIIWSNDNPNQPSLLLQ